MALQRFALLLICGLTCLATGTLAVDCEAKSEVRKAVLGGKEVQQKYVQMAVAGGRCMWVKDGSTPTAFTMENCNSCRQDSSGSMYCLGSGVMAGLPPCSVELGPDCAWHTVHPFDKKRACDREAFLEEMRKMLAAYGS